MKRTLLLLLLSLNVATYVHAQELTREVILSEDHQEETFSYPFYNISVKLVGVDKYGNTTVKVVVDNPSDKNLLFLFGKSYTEKELGKQPLSIKFDKSFPFDQGRDIKGYDESGHDVFIPDSGEETLPEIKITEGSEVECRLPIYTGKYSNKRRTKVLLCEMKPINLKISVAEKTDSDFVRLEQGYAKLMEEIGNYTFCANPKHRKEQEKSFRDKITDIQKEFYDIKDKKGIYKYNKEGQKYDVLAKKLQEIELTQYKGVDCGHHSTPRIESSCKYCKLTPQQIYNKMDYYYRQVNNGKATKSAVMSDVNLLYGCRKHSASWKKSEYRSKITDRYERIKKF